MSIPDLASRFSVRSYPTILFLHNGRVYTYEGERTVSAFRKFAKEGHVGMTHKAMPAKDEQLGGSPVWNTIWVCSIQSRRSHLKCSTCFVTRGHHSVLY